MEKFQSTPFGWAVHNWERSAPMIATLPQEGLVGFLLDLVQFLLGEIRQWQDIVNARPINAPVEDLSTSAVEGTAVDHSGGECPSYSSWRSTTTP